MSMWIQVLGAFGASLSLSIPFFVPKRFLFWAGAVGAIGWAIYLWMLPLQGVVFSAFLSSVVIALFSHILARWAKAPATMFLVPGILPLVPGVSVYRVIYYLMQNDSARSMKYLAETLQIAAMIALAFLIVGTLFRTLSEFSAQRSKGSKKRNF